MNNIYCLFLANEIIPICVISNHILFLCRGVKNILIIRGYGKVEYKNRFTLIFLVFAMMDNLPDEILVKIASFLKDLLPISHVNRRWYALVHTKLWKKPEFAERVNLIDIAEYPIEEISSNDLRDFSGSVFITYQTCKK